MGQALAHPVPQQQQAGVNVEKRQNGGEDLIGDFLEIQGIRGDGGDLIEQVEFPVVFLLPRFRLIQFLPGVYGCLFRHSRVSLGVCGCGAGSRLPRSLPIRHGDRCNHHIRNRPREGRGRPGSRWGRQTRSEAGGSVQKIIS